MRTASNSGDQKEFKPFAKPMLLSLELFAEYMAIQRSTLDLKAWTEWPDAAIRAREPKKLWLNTVKKLADQLTLPCVTQFFFFQQWLALKA